jgi:uncharacterized protein (TIGR00255 family)
VNQGFADAYMIALNSLSTRYGFDSVPATTAIDLLAKNPEVLVFDKFESAMNDDTKKELWETLNEALTLALIHYNKMRDSEGSAMVDDIINHHTKSVELLGLIKERAPKIIDEQSERLRSRINDMIGRMGNKPDDGRILTEIAVLADKGCISEEIARLESHLQQLMSMLKEESVGRKMDFPMQELNSEANTIGSKTSDIQMTNLAVELKSIIEKIREQVQNIE